jgi:hypothetical protein
LVPKPTSEPIIPDLSDRLQLKALEGEYLKAQLRQRDAGAGVQAAQQQLQMFAAVLYEKAGIKPDEWNLDIDRLAFVPKG